MRVHSNRTKYLFVFFRKIQSIFTFLHRIANADHPIDSRIDGALNDGILILRELRGRKVTMAVNHTITCT